MEWSYRSGNQERHYNILETVVAIKPQPQLFDDFNRSARLDWQTQAAVEPGADIALSPPYREIFERQGWVFTKATALTASVAKTRMTPAGLRAVAEIAINENNEPTLTTDIVVVQMPENFSEDRIKQQIADDGLILVRRLRFANNLFELRIPPGRYVPDVLRSLQANTDAYVFAEAQVLEIIAGRSTPTDPEFTTQWQHERISSVGAWGVTRGRGVRIAVIDNGFDIQHRDLKDGIVGGGAFHLTGNSANFVKLNPADHFPSHPHGTFCLGMAGARADNGFGGCGSAPEAGLLAISCLRDQVGPQSTLARAIAYAADPNQEDPDASPADGAHVISCSLGGVSAFLMQQPLKLAIEFAAKARQGRGVPIFWAVSDQNSPLELDQVCSHPSVIAVGRSNQQDVRDVCAFGPKLEFLAPGRSVYSTVVGGGYDFGSGTSFAAPLAAGVAALVIAKHLIAKHPDWTADQIRHQVARTCDPIQADVEPYIDGRNDRCGHGRLNANRAVNGTVPLN